MNQPTTNIRDLKQKSKLPAKQAGGSTVAKFFEVNKPAMQAVLPKHVSADRMLKVALHAVRAVPQLLECTTESLFGAVIQCSQLGLEPNTVLGHAYLIPFRNRKAGRTDVQMIIGYKGLLDLARRSGQIVSIAAHDVCENDDFNFSYGLEERLEHTPAMSDRGNITAFYAVAKLQGGGYAFEVMSRDQIDKIKANTQSRGQYGPWKDHYPEMGRKTVIRRLAKYLPLSIEFSTATALDGMAESGQEQGLAAALEGDFTVMDESAPRLNDAPGNKPTPETETQEETTRVPWPQQIHDEETGELRWADSAGQLFNLDVHSMSKDGKTPSVTRNGRFRARRGTAKQSETETETVQGAQGGANSEASTVTADELADRVNQATTPEELDNIEDISDESLTDPAERNAVKAIVLRKRTALAQ